MVSKIKINFGNQESPAGEVQEHEMPKEEHDVHMEEMKAGLQQIMQSQDINEIHSIAQGLLGKEEQEASVEKKEGNPSGDYMSGMDKIFNR